MYSVDTDEPCVSGASATERMDEKKQSMCQESWVRESRSMPPHLAGPTQFWMEFYKQAEALAIASQKSNSDNSLCTFVYHRDNGCRKFVVAHPEVYWWHYKHRLPESRNSFEIIPENSPCRLYLDLEYLTELNPKCNGTLMTSTLIDIICSYLLAYWSLPCNKYQIVNLDSSDAGKFSRHIIFAVKHTAFKDNYHAGRFVKFICKDIADYVSFKKESHDVLSHFDRVQIEKLFVQTRTGKKLFVDESVYTKNRHFRIYKSTKWGKCSYLTISEDCKYIPSGKSKDKELNIFLDSLISFFPSKEDTILLEFFREHAIRAETFKEVSACVKYQYGDNNSISRYPMLDEYIRRLIHPGKIRLVRQLDDLKMLVYEIVGYRFCENIGRYHKSNNVFWVVDRHKNIIYQKCHDSDCYGFKSEPKNLPDNVFLTCTTNTDVVR